MDRNLGGAERWIFVLLSKIYFFAKRTCLHDP